MSLAPGTILGGRFVVGNPLGGGGWGDVYEGRQLDLDRRVAIKVLREGTEAIPEAIARFEREARAAAALGHPNIVQISHFETPPDGPPFLVMELFHGKTLARMIREGAIPAARAIPIFAQILSALDAAHAAGIVHRDVKPANVFVIALAGGADLVKVLDFGIARLDAASKLTETGTLLGTPRYMAPEQLLGHDVDGRADVYSVGATLHHTLAGKTSITAKDPDAVLRAVASGEHEPLAAACPGIDPAIAAIVARALASDPAARFASAKEMEDALVDLARAIEAAPDTVVSPPPPPASPLARAALAIAAIALAVVAAGVAITAAFVVHAKGTAGRASPSSPSVSLAPAPSAEPVTDVDAAIDAKEPERESVPDAAVPVDAAAPTAPRAPRRWIVRAGMYHATTDVPDGTLPLIQSRHPAIAACFTESGCDTHSPIDVEYKIYVEDGAVFRINHHKGDVCVRIDRCVSSIITSQVYPRGVPNKPGLIDVSLTMQQL